MEEGITQIIDYRRRGYYRVSMKKILLTSLVALILLSSLSAASFLMTVGSELGGSNTIGGPYMGIHTYYHIGAAVSEKSSVGIGSTMDVDLGLPSFDSGYYKSSLAFTFGPSFSGDLSESLTLSLMLGPVFDLHKTKEGGDSHLGAGIGGTIELTFVPGEERKARTQLGFSLGLSGSATMNLSGGSLSSFFSGKVFFGVTTIHPYTPYWRYNVYDDILSDIYDIY